MRDMEIVVSGVVKLAEPAGEYDKRLVILSRELGRISVFSSGCRRPSSPLLAASRPFVFAHFKLRPSRTAYRLVKAEPFAYFEDLPRDLERMTYATFFMDYAGLFLQENMDGKDLLNLLYVTFQTLMSSDLPLDEIRRRFKWRVWHMIGEAPCLTSCRICQRPVDTGTVIIEPAKGGVLCPHCAKGGSQEREASLDTLLFMARLLSCPLTRLYSMSWPADREEWVFWYKTFEHLREDPPLPSENMLTKLVLTI